jgi:hypothetical protein
VTVAIILFAVLAMLAVALVGWPLVAGRASEQPADPRSDERLRLREEIDRSLAAIREIEFDHRAGNLAAADFEALIAEERARASDLLRRRDELEAEDDSQAGAGGAGPDS